MQEATPSPDAKRLTAEAVQHWGDQLGSDKLASAIAASDRFNSRAVNRVYKAHRLDEPEQGAKSVSNVVVRAYLAHKKRFATLCGLIMHGATIRKMITEPEYEQLAQSFAAEDVSLACKQTDLHVHNSEIDVPEGGLAAVVERAGEGLVETWKVNLPPAAIAELNLYGEANFDGERRRLTRIDPQISVTMAERVAALLLADAD